MITRDRLNIKGVLMEIELDLHSKAIELLEKIANSVHDRCQGSANLLCFSTSEVDLVEQWLKEFKDTS